MPYEATMLLVDNSAHALNGDYPPTRILAQADAVNTLFNAKTLSNPENVVGLMSIAGKGPEMLVAPTNDQGKIVSALDVVKTRLYGNADIATSLQIAQLALKHRPDSTQRQRIIVFVGSPQPISALESLIATGKKLKKNNVAVDVILFGSEFYSPQNADQQKRLEEFVETVNSSDNSHFVAIPPNQLLSDTIRASPILSEDVPQGMGASGSGADGAGVGDDAFGGVNAEIDPELAMALQLSLQEAQREQAQQREQQNATEATTTTSDSTSTTAAPVSEELAAVPIPSTTSSSIPIQENSQPEEQQPLLSTTKDNDEEMSEDEDETLKRALQLSKEEDADMDGDSSSNR